MVAGNKMRFHEDQEIYLEMLSSMSTAPLKEEFSLRISIFPSLLPLSEGEVVVDLLTKNSTSSTPVKEELSLSI